MPSGKLRVALAALGAVLTAQAMTPAGAQSARPKSPASPQGALRPLASPSPSAAPHRASAAPGDLDLAIPADDAPLMRGPLRETDPPVSTAASYGPPGTRQPKPYPPARLPYPRPFSPKTALPPLEPYATSFVSKTAVRRRPARVDAFVPPPPVTVAVQPAPDPKPKPKPKVEQNPYDPPGVSLGSVIFSPYVQASGGYDDNPNRLAPDFNPRPSSFFRGEGGVKVKSDWSRHNLEGELRGGYSEYFDYQKASRPDASGQMAARYDVTRDTSLDLLGKMALDTLRPGAPSLSSGQQNVYVTSRPVTLGVGTQAGATQKFGRLAVSLRGTYDRVWYQNAAYSDGTTLELARTSYNDFGALLRASYEATPDLKPFIEGTIDRRVHDSPTDFNGFYRDSTGFIVRGGGEINVTALVKGEVSGGYGQRDYQDPRLPALRGPVVDAALIYTPSPLTTVTLRGSTALNETTLANAAGALSRAVTATLSHDLMRNLNVTLTGSYFTNDYQGANVRERGANLGVKLEYKVTRSVSLRASYMHERLDSSYANADYTANVYLVGLRFQL
ncbi:MAG: outer membrane beta-barrel protein [Methylocystis sp.]|uniref:outer membrane beta-barrel protein n=1 Tax=Methylocystis sp. TaxID=1911079 RepID=UPI003DA34D32